MKIGLLCVDCVVGVVGRLSLLSLSLAFLLVLRFLWYTIYISSSMSFSITIYDSYISLLLVLLLACYQGRFFIIDGVFLTREFRCLHPEWWHCSLIWCSKPLTVRLQFRSSKMLQLACRLKQSLPQLENQKAYSARQKSENNSTKKTKTLNNLAIWFWLYHLIPSLYPFHCLMTSFSLGIIDTWPIAKTALVVRWAERVCCQGLPKTSSPKGLILYNSQISACGKNHAWKDRNWTTARLQRRLWHQGTTKHDFNIRWKKYLALVDRWFIPGSGFNHPSKVMQDFVTIHSISKVYHDFATAMVAIFTSQFCRKDRPDPPVARKAICRSANTFCACHVAESIMSKGLYQKRRHLAPITK